LSDFRVRGLYHFHRFEFSGDQYELVKVARLCLQCVTGLITYVQYVHR
jgi:hypothetical protein